MSPKTGTIFNQTRGSPAPHIGLPDLYTHAQEVLLSVTSVFPFTLFPHKIIIRRNHVDIVKGIFFGSAETQRILYSDIREVMVSYNPVFASINFMIIGPPEIDAHIKFLPLGRAMRAKRILGGLMESHRKQVDISAYSKRDLIAYLDEIGKTSV
jgi:hypothetical protein